MSGECFPQHSQTGKQQQGKDRRGQQTVLQVVAPGGGDQSHQTGTGGASQVSGQGQQGKQGGAAAGKTGCRQTKGARPHAAHRHAAQGAPHQRQSGPGGEGDQQVSGDAQDGAGRHKAGGGGVTAAVSGVD